MQSQMLIKYSFKEKENLLSSGSSPSATDRVGLPNTRSQVQGCVSSCNQGIMGQGHQPLWASGPSLLSKRLWEGTRGSRTQVTLTSNITVSATQLRAWAPVHTPETDLMLIPKDRAPSITRPGPLPPASATHLPSLVRNTFLKSQEFVWPCFLCSFVLSLHLFPCISHLEVKSHGVGVSLSLTSLGPTASRLTYAVAYIPWCS